MNHQKGNRSSTVSSYKTFVKYEPELAEELSIKKPKNCLVSGTLLSLVYQRLSFWSVYAKHKHNGKRYFWKSTEELGNEIKYSRKQVERAIKVLLELGMIIREKLNKRNWKQVYYYFLPHSRHTAEIEAPVKTAVPFTSQQFYQPQQQERDKPSSGKGFSSVQSFETDRGRRLGKNVSIKTKEELHINKTLEALVERCNAMGRRKTEQDGFCPVS
jgi:predicted transcriptional regulator